jgi:hypothetical protein
MVPHIGKIIHALVEQRNIPIAEVEKVIGRGDQAVYRMFREEVINSDRLLKVSFFFRQNLFLCFQEHELLKDLPNPQIIQLQQELAEANTIIAQRQNTIAERDRRIEELKDVLSIVREENQRLKKSQEDPPSQSAQ